MTKIYLVWDRYTNAYFSVVAGKVRCNSHYDTYAYDRKHATMVLQAVKRGYRRFKRSTTALCLKEVPIMQVELTDPFYRTASAKLFTSRKLSFYDGLRQLKYEQVRRYIDYISYDPRLESHSLKLAIQTI